MRRSLFNILAVAGFGILLSSSVKADEGQFFSTIIGAGVGGLLGNSIGHGDGRAAATGAGIVLGGVIGSELGRPSYGPGSSEPAYYGYAPPSYPYTPYQPNYVAPPSPPPAPPSTYIDDESGSYCREYSQTVRIGDQMQESYGTVCLQADGRWHIVP